MSGVVVPSTRPVWRPMTTADLERVMAVEVQAYPFPWSRGHFADSLAAGYHAQMLLRDDRLLGYYVAMPGVDEMHLLNLTVAPDHQRRGHARTLLAHLAAAARAAGAALVWLEVRESNQRARALYERWGFEAVGRRKGYYPAGHGRREDALVMRWAVPAVAPQGVGDGLD